jgi:hypothetical protein
MNAPNQSSDNHKRPTADDLAGIPVTADGPEDLTVRPAKPRKGGKMAPLPALSKPTADDLAGIPITADGPEDLTVRPRKPRPKQ